MEEVNINLLHKVASYVKALYEDSNQKLFKYHNLEHTIDVVKACEEISSHHSLSKEEKLVLLIAAWFHDVGCWARSKLENHESEGAKIAKTFLLENGMGEEFVEKVQSCIYSTQMPQKPSVLIEKILCDADLSHLARDDYYQRSLKLREELMELKLLNLDLDSWLRSNLIFLNKHQYKTEYCQQKCQIGKQKNINTLIEKIEATEQKSDKKKKKKKGTERGVETLFRTTSRNHLELSSIADNKANIMISVNSIILTIIVSVLLRKLEEYPNYIIPTTMLLATSLVTMVFAILATRPNVTSGKVTKESIDNKEGNLLYFGNFHEMSLAEYEYGMGKMLDNADYLYGSMTRDIYYLGKVLAKKYVLLRKSYTVFMFGFIISILAFAVATIFFPVDTY
ncbi:HD domain-containing protein [Echinicola marina]|uniref:Pycsar system effector family protein n=1 Tax=Echinicola marina TaxID=2859768 RepID=UPI001CF6DDAB|nr:Pycsar system effector family protein [Echinicola marina]UCS92477.1 HD domain-containing protein [Echinicola marina]